MLACPRCNTALPETFYNAPDLQPCPACRIPVRIEAFPALLAPPPAPRTAEAILIEGESSCFYHPAKRAVVACEGCGRFLCALCDVDLNGQHLCPGCLQSGKRKGKLKNLENHRLLYDSLALILALAPVIIFYPFVFITPFTAPGVIFVVVRYWNAPRSIIGRGRWRMVVAFIVALLQIAGWIALGIFLYRTFSHQGTSR
jgi:hypothetical protein